MSRRRAVTPGRAASRSINTRDAVRNRFTIRILRARETRRRTPAACRRRIRDRCSGGRRSRAPANPAPATSTIASAISTTVITLSQRAVPRPPLVDRVLSLISVRTSVPASRSAGANPTSRPLTTSAPSTNSSTRPSNVTASRRGNFEAPSVSSARRRRHTPSAPRATAPAAGQQRRLGEQLPNDAAARPRRATTRTAISRARAAPRASSRLVTLTHASRSSSPVADITIDQDRAEIADDRRRPAAS